MVASMLRVERLAKRDKELNAKSEQSYIDSIRDLVHAEISARMSAELEDIGLVYGKILGADDSLPVLLDHLSVKASSIGKIHPLVSSMPWMYDELIKLVNSPKYRRTDSKGKVIAVENLRMALGYFGLENLKMVVPALCFRRWIPQITDPYPQIKTRMWEHALGTALSCKKIAQVHGIDEGNAFTMGMFHTIGKIVVTRLYFRLFEAVQREALQEAHNDKKREEYTALTQITPSGDFLNELISQYAMDTTARLIRHMGMRRVFIANAIEEYAENEKLTDMSPMGQTLVQGIAYSQYRILKGYRLLNMDEAKLFLAKSRMPPGALSLLRTTDLRSLNLSMDEEK